MVKMALVIWLLSVIFMYYCAHRDFNKVREESGKETIGTSDIPESQQRFYGNWGLINIIGIVIIGLLAIFGV